jgi:hypothetical protein
MHTANLQKKNFLFFRQCEPYSLLPYPLCIFRIPPCHFSKSSFASIKIHSVLHTKLSRCYTILYIITVTIQNYYVSMYRRHTFYTLSLHFYSVQLLFCSATFVLYVIHYCTVLCMSHSRPRYNIFLTLSSMLFYYLFTSVFFV